MSWRQVSCEERDAFYAAGIEDWCPGSTLTDLDGQFGEPEMFIEWWDRETEQPQLRDQRWPRRGGERPDARPCQHHVWDEDAPEGTAP
jgi:hypothetical protein